MMLSAGSLALTNLMGGVRYLSANWLHIRLLEIFGSSLIGLWIGEDVVTNGTDVTSWPGRVGGTLTASNTNYYQVATLNGRKAATTAVAVAQSYVSASLGVAIKAIYSVFARPSASGYGWSFINNYDSGSNALTLNGLRYLNTSSVWSHYVNGFVDEDLDPLTAGTPAVVEAYKADSIATIASIGTTAGAGSLMAPHGASVYLSSVPTPAQRILATAALKRYYGIAVTEQEVLAEGLARIYGSILVGLWIGEDLVADGATNVTSWPGRAGPTLTNQTANYYTLGAIGARQAITKASNATIACLYGAGLSANANTSIVVATTPALPFPAYAIAGDIASSNVGGWNPVTGNTLSSVLYSTNGQVHYLDGVANTTHDVPTGSHIHEGISSTATNNTKHGAQNQAFHWLAPVACGVLLSATQSAAQRAACLTLLRNYYSLP